MGLFDIFKGKKEAEKKIENTVLDAGLAKSKAGLFSRITKSLIGKSTIDDEVLDMLEEILVSADVGVPTTLKIIERLQSRVVQEKYVNASELNRILRSEVVSLLQENATDLGNSETAISKPYVILVVGVNGVGKTTTIGKIAHRFTQSGYKVVLGAADTFRAAAVEQLAIWGSRTGARVVSGVNGSDPASVAYEAVRSCVALKEDLCIIDTAGRLHNKVGLMNELTKIRNVITKVIPDGPNEILLVLDASTGQNAIEQAKQFMAATNITAMALTKLDGTAKGGVVIGISDQLQIPVKYIGLGEKMEDLQLFDRERFVNALFQDM